MSLTRDACARRPVRGAVRRAGLWGGARSVSGSAPLGGWLVLLGRSLSYLRDGVMTSVRPDKHVGDINESSGKSTWRVERAQRAPGPRGA